MMNRLDEIEAIRQLKARYFRLMDTKDWEGWRDVFTEDLAVTVDTAVSTRGADGKSLPTRHGVDEFISNTRGSIENCVTVHHGHMPEIELTSATTARGIWAMEDILRFPDGRGMRGYGHYHETYRKDAETWRIATLHLTRTHLEYSAG